MATFIYTVKDEYGRALSGFVQASSAREVKRKIRDDDYFFVGCRKANKRAIFRRKVSSDQLLMFTHRLTALVEAGIPILAVTKILWRQSEDVTMQLMISHLRERLEAGSKISEALNDFPRIFPPMYRALIGVAEVGGDLVYVLKKLSEYLEYQREMIVRMKKATFYPAIVFAFSIIVILGMFIFVVPTFETVLSKLKVELPTLTRMILDLSNLMRTWQFFAGVALILFAGWTLYQQLEQNRGTARWLDGVKLKIPFFGSIIYSIALSRFIRSLSLLLGSGMPAVTSFEVARSTIVNHRLESAVDEVKKEVEEGNSMYSAFNAQRIFPVMLVEMIGIGESSGTMVRILERLVTHLDGEVDYRVNKFLTALEPMLIIFVGGIVALTLLAIYLPITSLWSGLTG